MESLLKHIPNAELIPLIDNGKIPVSAGWRTKNYTKEALTKTNKGFLCGNGIGTIDWDLYNTTDKNKEIFTLEMLIEKFNTFTVETPRGGYHTYHLECDEMKKWGNKTKLDPSGGREEPVLNEKKENMNCFIDYRGLGGFVVAPDSITKDGIYKIVHNVPLTSFKDACEKELFDDFNRHFLKVITDGKQVNIDEDVMITLNKTFTNIKFKTEYSFDCDQRGKKSKCPLCDKCHESNYFNVYQGGDSVYVKSFSERCKPLLLKDGSKITGYAFGDDVQPDKSEVCKVKSDFSEYEIMRKDFETKVFQIMNPLCWGELQDDKSITVRTKDEIKTIYCGRKIEGKSFIKMWHEDEQGKRKYNKMDFLPPPIVCPETTYNMWSDFQVEEIEGGECDTWVNLVNNLQIGKFVIDWFANIIQNPGKRSEKAVIITGVEGSGKNSILLPIYKILGDDKWFATGDPENHIFGKFANGLVRKLLVVLEETDPKQTFSNSEKLKTMITEATIPYEGKGKDVITVKNLANFFGTSNFNRPVKLSKSDRRYVLDEMPDTYVDNKQYWKEFHIWLNNPANIWALYKYLKERDLSKVDFNERPITETFLDVQRSCLPMEIKFLEDMTYNFKKSWVNSIQGKELFAAYKTFAGKAFENMASSAFSKNMIKLNVPGITSLKPNNQGSRWQIDITLVRNWLLENKYMVVQVYKDESLEELVKSITPLDPNICLIDDDIKYTIDI